MNLDWIIKKLLLLLCCCVCNQAGAGNLEENKVLAALSLNIIRFSTWPNAAAYPAVPNMNLCVIGDNVVQSSFAVMDKKAIGKQTLAVINLTRLRNFAQCQVIFIDELPRNVLLQILGDVTNKPVLTIGQDLEFLNDGGLVGLIKIDEKISLHINLAAVKKSGLTISSRLLKLAKIVNE